MAWTKTWSRARRINHHQSDRYHRDVRFENESSQRCQLISTTTFEKWIKINKINFLKKKSREWKVNLTWQRFTAIEADVMEASDTLLWRCCCRYDRPETPRWFLYTQFKMAAALLGGHIHPSWIYYRPALYSFIYIFYSHGGPRAQLDAGCVLVAGHTHLGVQ